MVVVSPSRTNSVACASSRPTALRAWMRWRPHRFVRPRPEDAPANAHAGDLEVAGVAKRPVEFRFQGSEDRVVVANVLLLHDGTRRGLLPGCAAKETLVHVLGRALHGSGCRHVRPGPRNPDDEHEREGRPSESPDRPTAVPHVPMMPQRCAEGQGAVAVHHPLGKPDRASQPGGEHAVFGAVALQRTRHLGGGGEARAEVLGRDLLADVGLDLPGGVHGVGGTGDGEIAGVEANLDPLAAEALRRGDPPRASVPGDGHGEARARGTGGRHGPAASGSRRGRRRWTWRRRSRSGTGPSGAASASPPGVQTSRDGAEPTPPYMPLACTSDLGGRYPTWVAPYAGRNGPLRPAPAVPSRSLRQANQRPTPASAPPRWAR